MLNCGIDYTNWWEITDALMENRGLAQDNPFTKVFYEAVKTINWREILKDPPPLDELATIEERLSFFMDGPDSRLKEYMRTLLLTWADTRARRNKTSAHELARKIVKVYLDQIDWENVYEKYKSS